MEAAVPSRPHYSLKTRLDYFFEKPLVRRKFNAAANIGGDLRGFASNIPKFLDRSGIYASSSGIEGKCIGIFGDFCTFLKGVDCTHRSASFFYNILWGKDKDNWDSISLVEPLDALGNIPIGLGSLTRAVLGVPLKAIELVNFFIALAPVIMSFVETLGTVLGIIGVVSWAGYVLRSLFRSSEVFYVIWRMQTIEPKFVAWTSCGLSEGDARQFCEKLKREMQSCPRFAKSFHRLTGKRDVILSDKPIPNHLDLMNTLAKDLNLRRYREVQDLCLFSLALFITIGAIVLTGGSMPIVLVCLSLLLTTLFFVLNNVREYREVLGNPDKASRYDKHFLIALCVVLAIAITASLAIVLTVSTGGILPVVLMFVAAGLSMILQIYMIYDMRRHHNTVQSACGRVDVDVGGADGGAGNGE